MLQSSKLSNRFKLEKQKEQINELQEVLIQGEVVDLPQQTFDSIEIKKALLNKIEGIPVWFDYTPEKQKELINSFVQNYLSDVEISEEQKRDLLDDLYMSITGFGPLDYLISQENVSSIFVNGLNSVYIEIGGKVLNTEISLTDRQLEFILMNIKKLSVNKPQGNIWNCRINNMLIFAILPPVAGNGGSITIRKILPSDANSLIDKKFLTREIYDFLVSAIALNKNIVISADVNSGKTSLIDGLISEVLKSKRIILVEEFQQFVSESPNIIKYLKPDNENEFQLLLSNIVRMLPEYFVMDINKPVFIDVTGMMMTIRASSVDSAMNKLISSLVFDGKCSEKYAKSKILSDIDYIVQINDGRITSIVELSLARTAALSVKEIVKLVDDEYVTNIPQPLTSIRACCSRFSSH